MGEGTCTVDGCDDLVRSIGLCGPHYSRNRVHGDPLGGGPRRANKTSPRPVVDHSDGTRICNSCGERQQLDNFGVDRSGTNGRRSQCKTCRSGKMKAWYAENQERQRDRQRLRYAANGDQIRTQDMERYLRHRDKRIALATKHAHRRNHRLRSREYDPTVTTAALRERLGDRCAYCDTSMDFGSYTASTRPPNQASLEHIIPVSKGGTHTWDNVTLACLSCNLAKNAKDLDDWLATYDSLGAA